VHRAEAHGASRPRTSCDRRGAAMAAREGPQGGRGRCAAVAVGCRLRRCPPRPRRSALQRHRGTPRAPRSTRCGPSGARGQARVRRRVGTQSPHGRLTARAPRPPRAAQCRSNAPVAIADEKTDHRQQRLNVAAASRRKDEHAQWRCVGTTAAASADVRGRSGLVERQGLGVRHAAGRARRCDTGHCRGAAVQMMGGLGRSNDGTETADRGPDEHPTVAARCMFIALRV
jgi:hypothetical protein